MDLCNIIVTEYVYVILYIIETILLEIKNLYLDDHYIDVIMTMMASQITSLTVVYSIVYSGADQRKHQSSASLAFVRGIHRDRWIPRTNGQWRGKCFHLMTSSWLSHMKLQLSCCVPQNLPNSMMYNTPTKWSAHSFHIYTYNIPHIIWTQLCPAWFVCMHYNILTCISSYS